MDYVAIALKNVFDRHNSITHGVKILKEASVLGHFTIELKKL